MTINNNTNLINQICTFSGLSGKALEELKTRLVKMSEAELQAELTKAIAGNNFAGDMGLVVEKTFTTPQSNITLPKPSAKSTQSFILKEKQCKEVACQIIDENLREAIEVFDSQHLGSISGAYDSAKDEDNKLKMSNVAKVIGYQQAGLTQIIDAKNKNLTRRQYYEENKQRIKDMILTRLNVLKTLTGASYIDSFRGKYSKEEMTEIINAYVERLCSDASIEKLKNIQLQFVSYNQVEEAEALSNFVKNAKDFQENWRDTTFRPLGNEGKAQILKGPDKGFIPSYWDSDEPIAFEEVYKLERGTNYSQYEIEKYVQAKTEMETVINAYNKKQQFVDFTDALRKEELTLAEKEEKMLAGFAEFYALSEDGGLSQLQKIINTSKLPIAIKNGKLDLSGFPNDTSKIKVLNQLLKLARQEKEKEFNAFLGDKTLEEYQLSFEKSANSILGEENGKQLADAMVNDNMGMIKRYTGNTSMAGMALTVIGGILCFTPAAPLGAVMVTTGNTVAIGGMVAKTGLGFADYVTKDVQTQEELIGLGKDFIMDAGGFIIGMKAGQAGMRAFNNLIDQKLVAVFGQQISQGNKLQALKTVFANPEYLKSFSKAAGAKISTDFLISYMGDLAMMGALDTQDDWKSLLQANLTGILVGMSGDVKDAAGVGNIRINHQEVNFISANQSNNDVPSFGKNFENPKDGVTTKPLKGFSQGVQNNIFSKTKNLLSKTIKSMTQDANPFKEIKGGENTGIKPEYKVFEIKNATDAELAQVQKIDIEAFNGRYEVSSNFETYKADLAKEEISTYVINAEDGSVVGYYQLEPVENGELYIHSIGVRSDLRNTRASYNALKQMQENITKFARENNVEKVALDVDANKLELVKLYKKFGFEVTSENKGIEAGQEYHDLHMVADVKKVLGEKTENSEKAMNNPQPQKNRQILVSSYDKNVSCGDIERMQAMSKRPANSENDVEFIMNSFDTKEFPWEQDPTKLFAGRFLRVDEQIEGYFLHKKLPDNISAKTGTELFVSINPDADKATVDAVKVELSDKLNSLIQKEKIKDITVKVDPSNKALIEFLEQEGFSKTGIEEGYFTDGSAAEIYRIDDAQLRNIDNHFRETGKTDLFTTKEQKDIIYENCAEFYYDSEYNKVFSKFENAQNRELFTKENISKLEELANKYNLNVQDIIRDRIDILSSTKSMSEIEEIFKIRSQINAYKTDYYTKESAEAQVEFLKHKNELLNVISDDSAIDGVIKHIKDKSQLEGILYVLRDKNLTNKFADVEESDAAYKLLHTLSRIESLDDARAKVDFINKMSERFGNEDKSLSEILEITYNSNLFQKFNAKEAEKMISTVVDKFKDRDINVKQLRSLCNLVSDGSYDQVLRILDNLSKPEVDGLDSFEAMFMSDHNPSRDFSGKVLDIFEEFNGMNVGSIKPDILREKVWYAAQMRSKEYIAAMKELKANRSIPDNLKLFCHMLDEEHPELIWQQLSAYPKEKVDTFIESKLMQYVSKHNMDFINTDINTDIVKKYNLTRYIDYFNDHTVNIINSLDDAKLQKIKDVGLFKKVYRLEDLGEFYALEEAAFDRISKRNLLSMKQHRYDTEGLNARQIREGANLTDIEWQRSLELPENTTFNARLQLAKLDEVQYSEFKNVAEYLKNNKKMLQQADMTELTDQKINALLMDEDNLSGSVEILRIAGADVLKHAAELRYKGYNEFIKNGRGLAKLPNDLRQILIERISKLPHPEQKIEKLQMIASITSVAKPEVIETLINNIIPPTMTKEQKLQTDIIFSTDKLYEEQVEDFIRQFNVPANRQDDMRQYLLGAKLNEKFVTPPSAAEQIAIINKKIQSINSNDKIPEDKKQSYLVLLNKQIEDIRSNPDEYTRPRINDRAIKPLEQRVEAYINLPNSQREFNCKLNSILYETIGVDATPQLLDAFEYDNKYFARLFNAGNTNFRTNFQRLLELVKLNPDRKFTELVKELPENIETKRLFEENGLDFDRWTRFDEQSNQPFTVKVDIEKSVQSARTNLLNELSSELAKHLDTAEIAKLNQILQDNNIDTAGQKDLPKIIKLIEKELETNEYWKGTLPDIKTFKDHIQIHKKNIHEVEQLRDTTEELYVRLWDNDNIGRNIFFGNHVGCCTSVGSSNSFAAPQHLMNSFVNGIEIVDKSGNSMGNSMCYFAKVDNKITFVIDSFEANGKLGASSEVTNAVIEYAKKVCSEMGVPNANIMFGPNYNKIDFSRCIKTEGHKIEIIGRAPDATYIDCIGGHGNVNTIYTSRPMHEIMDL